MSLRFHLTQRTEDDEDDYETLFGSRSAASTPATSLEHSGIFTIDAAPAGNKRARQDDSDNDSTDSFTKRVKVAPPSSPVIVEDDFVAVKVEEDDDEEEEVLFEAVEDDNQDEEGPRLFSCALFLVSYVGRPANERTGGGEMISYDVIAADLALYQSKMVCSYSFILCRRQIDSTHRRPRNGRPSSPLNDTS
jgi:hypothetical protein